MKAFSFIAAWTQGLRFFEGQALGHAVILIGMGVAAPVLLQLLLGSPTEGGFGSGGRSAAAVVAAGVVASLTGYVLQVGSLFASWRLGFAGDGRVISAMGYGLLVGLASLLVFALLIAVGFAVAQLVPLAGVLVGGLAIFFFFFFVTCTAMAALVAAGISLALGLAVVFGVATGNTGLAATLVGGSGFIVVLLIVAAGVSLWLGGRFSCASILLAERRSFDLVAAMRDSWALTWDDEWRIMRYLAGFGFALAVFFLVLVTALGAALSGTLQDANWPGDVKAIAAVQLIFGIPLIYLAVMVPAGIYRELAGAPAPVEVFA